MVSSELFLSHILTFLLTDAAFAQQLLPVFKYVITEVQLLLLIGSASASSWSSLDPSGTGSTGEGGGFTEKSPL